MTTTEAVRATGAIPLAPSNASLVGARIVATSIVVSQFIDVTIAQLGGFVISAQKLGVLVALPIGVVLLGRFSLPRAIVQPYFVFAMAMSAALLAGLSVPGLGESLLTAMMTLAALACLYSAQRFSSMSASFLGRVWAVTAVLTAVVCVLQYAGAVPLLNVPPEFMALRYTGDGHVRGTGLKFDPNFQALVLAVGLVFCRVWFKSPWKFMATVMIALGILATASRMGAMLAIVAIIVATGASSRPRRGRLAIVALSASTFALLAVAALPLLPPTMMAYVAERIGDVPTAIATTLDPSQLQYSADSSGAQRSILLRGTVEVIRSHPLTGVGAGQLPAHLLDVTGDGNAAHNTILESVAIGGIFGAAFVLTFIVAMSSNLRALRLRVPRNVFSTVLGFAVVLGVASLFLTLTYSMILWLPLALASALVGRATDVEKATSKQPSTPRGEDSYARD